MRVVQRDRPDPQHGPALQRRHWLAAAAALALPPLATAAQSPAWPSRPLRLVMPFPAGATSDTLARVVMDAAGRRIGQPFLIDHRPGAGGTLGTREAARAEADGHHWLWGTVSNMAIAPALYANAGYDPLSDFAPVARLLRVPHVVTVHPDLQSSTLADLIARARERPGALSYASSGNGTISHLIGEMFQDAAGVRLLHVPYRSGPQGLPDHLAGRVDLRFDTVVDAAGPVQAGRLRALAVTGARRSPLLPDVPTAAEAGLAGFEASGWFAVYAPAGVADERIAAMAGALQEALALPAVRAALAPHGVDIDPAGPAALRAFTAAEVQRIGALVRRLDLRIT